MDRRKKKGGGRKQGKVDRWKKVGIQGKTDRRMHNA